MFLPNFIYPVQKRTILVGRRGTGDWGGSPRVPSPPPPHPLFLRLSNFFLKLGKLSWVKSSLKKCRTQENLRKTKQHGGRHTEKLRKNEEALVFLVFLRFLFFSLDFYKGRIAPNALQIALNRPQIIPLSIFSVSTPAKHRKPTGKESCRKRCKP